MNELAILKGGKIADFKPEDTREKISVLKAAVQHAREMENWEAGRLAAQWMVDEQTNFVAWWNEAVGVRHGSGRNKKNADLRSLISSEQAETDTGISQQEVSRWRKKLSNKKAYQEAIFSGGHKKAMEDEHNHRAQGTGENEWYTPAKYIEMARRVLGDIELDPASSKAAQTIVQAEKWYSAENNGLKQSWCGKVWLNPPYSQPLIGQFITKLVEERSADNVSAAIVLTHNYTDTAWFHEAAEIADAICFTRGRIKFVDPDGNECAPTQGQAFFYYGDRPSIFADVFKDIGFVLCPFCAT